MVDVVVLVIVVVGSCCCRRRRWKSHYPELHHSTCKAMQASPSPERLACEPWWGWAAVC